MAVTAGDEVYLRGDSNRDGSVRLLYGADVDGDGIPDAVQQHRVNGRWVEMSVSPAALAAGFGTATAAAAMRTQARSPATPLEYGGIGDGVSRPLSGIYGSLAAAQAVYPAVTALTQELDWAAIQTMCDSGAPRCFYPPGCHFITNSVIFPADNQEHYGGGPASIIDNIHARNTPSQDQVQASPFSLGNMHPIILNTAQTTNAWAQYPLNDVAIGDETVTVTTPGGVSRVPVAGEIVVIAAVANPVATGAVGIVYDFQMWNRVVSYDAGTGACALELPVPIAVPNSGASTIPTVPALVLNAHSDTFMGIPWRMAQGVTIRDMKLIGGSPIGLRSGGWRCKIRNLDVDCQQIMEANALALCIVENIGGYFSERFIEVKQWCQSTVFRNIKGVYKRDAGVTTLAPSISIGEQSFDCDFSGIDLFRGNTYSQNFRALEIYAQQIRFQGRIRDFGSGGQVEIWAIKSTTNTGRPPADIDLDLVVRGGDGLSQYGLIGTASNTADPTRISIIQNGTAKTAPGAAVKYVAGSLFKELAVTGDVLKSSQASPAEVPEGSHFLMTAIAGSVTYAQGETKVGTTQALLGCKIGDRLMCSIQQIGTVTAGTLSDLEARGVVNGAGTAVLYIQNKSATSVTITGATALWIWAEFRRLRA